MTDKDCLYARAKFLVWEHALPCTFGEDVKKWPGTFTTCDVVDFYVAGYRAALNGLGDELLSKARWNEEAGRYERVVCSHDWSKDGETCKKCGDKDWM